MATPTIRNSIWDNIPAADPPAGETSNLINPPSLGSAIRHVNMIALVVAAVVVLLRFFVRARRTRNLGWDDWTCGIAMLASIAHSSLILYDINLKLGVHIWNIPLSLFLDARNVRLLVSPSLLYPITIYFVKISILLLYKRVFGANRLLNLIIRIGIIFLSIFYTTYLCIQIATISQCISLSAPAQYPVCGNAYAINIFQSSLNVLTDFFVFLIPLRSLSTLQLSERRSIGLFLVFGFGFGVCAVSVARLALLAKTLQLNDPWNSGLISILSVIEINLGIILTSAPILVYLSKRKVPRPQLDIPFSRPESPRPPPPSKETSYQPSAPPSSRIGYHSQGTTPAASPWSKAALARALSPDREQYIELEDHGSPVSPIHAGRVELAGHHTQGMVHEVDARPARTLSARWYQSSRRF